MSSKACSCYFSLLCSRNGLPPKSTLFPYTTLFRSQEQAVRRARVRSDRSRRVGTDDPRRRSRRDHRSRREDRKSTRLNSSHRCISYAVFCLKKKTLHPITRFLFITLLHLRGHLLVL